MNDYTIKSTKAEAYLDTFGDFVRPMKAAYVDHPLIVELIEIFEQEQRRNIGFLQTHSTLKDHDPEHVVYSAMNPTAFESLCRTLAELLIERNAAEEMTPRVGDDIGTFLQDLADGSIGRQFRRRDDVRRSIDIEAQSVCYQFRRLLGHSKKRSTHPKTMEVLKRIRKALAALWQ